MLLPATTNECHAVFIFHFALETHDSVCVRVCRLLLPMDIDQVVLSACSSYFQKLLLENPCKHPTIILPGDIIFTDLKTIIDFVYRGEIDVTESELQVSGNI